MQFFQNCATLNVVSNETMSCAFYSHIGSLIRSMLSSQSSPINTQLTALLVALPAKILCCMHYYFAVIVVALLNVAWCMAGSLWILYIYIF